MKVSCASVILLFIVRAKALGVGFAAMQVATEPDDGVFKELPEGELVQEVNATLRFGSSAPSGRAGAWSSAVCKNSSRFAYPHQPIQKRCP